VRLRLNERLGKFPLFKFWGPLAGIESTRWIVDAARDVISEEKPVLTLVYLPHLDYDLQRFGPSGEKARDALRAVDAEVGRLVEAARARGAEVMVVSEYGIEAVSSDVALNRVLRGAGFVAVQNVLDSWELLDAGASRAFAIADHQLAHVYVRDARDVGAVKSLLERTEGVERVLDETGKRELGLDHGRAGELVAIASPKRWFSYYYWLDDARKPDFAATVDIFRKPGYDPAELFLRPGAGVRLGLRLAQKALGFRSLLDVVPTDGALVRGSHGRAPSSPEKGAVLVSGTRAGQADRVAPTAIKDLVLRTIFAG
jgi:predicted AlkP superfamily pyrophosphatase or phosphodiesterase